MPVTTALYRLLSIESAYAQPLQQQPIPGCGAAGLIGCGAAPGNPFVAGIIYIANLMIDFAAGAAVELIIWAGFQMLNSEGDEGKISTARRGVIYALLGLMLAGTSQLLVGYVATHDWTGAGSSLPVQLLSGIADALLKVFNAVFLVVVILSGLRMVISQGKSDEFNKGKGWIFWSVIGAILVNIAYALVNAFINFL